MSDTKPISELVGVTPRTNVGGTPVSSSSANTYEADGRTRVTDINSALTDQANHRAGATAPTDNTVEGQIWCNTTNDPAELYADLDGAGADVPISTGLFMKVVDIGDWDMDADISVNVAHGLTLSKIRLVQAMIRDDDGLVYYNLIGEDWSLPGATAENSIRATATNVTLFRATNGIFDDTDHDATSYNRGWVTIWHTA